jgi:RNA polymerase sigma-70 factor (ECF subfamily)
MKDRICGEGLPASAPGDPLTGRMALSGEGSIATRQSLLERLKNWDDQESWRDFFNLYWRLIYGVALRAGLGDAEVQEVVQETVLAVARNIGRFNTDPARGSFKAWLLNLVRWRITDRFRRQQREHRWRVVPPPDSETTPFLEKVPDPAGVDLGSIWEEEWERNLLDLAVERVRSRINPKHYQMFDLYVIKQWPVREVARALHVSASRVYLAKHRVTKLVQQELRSLEARDRVEE